MGSSRYKQKKIREPFFMLGKGLLLKCQSWKELSPAAKIFYITLKAKFNGCNNGQISLCYSELKDVKGLASSATIAKAIRELEQKGWIERTKRGGMYRNFNDFRITGKFDKHIINRS